MKPGRELDALVAEKVFGQLKPWVGGCWCGLRTSCPACDGTGYDPYSTDIKAAWEVVEKIGGMSIDGPMPNNTWWVTIGQGPVRGETAPHAICLAALKAVGE